MRQQYVKHNSVGIMADADADLMTRMLIWWRGCWWAVKGSSTPGAKAPCCADRRDWTLLSCSIKPSFKVDLISACCLQAGTLSSFYQNLGRLSPLTSMKRYDFWTRSKFGVQKKTLTPSPSLGLHQKWFSCNLLLLSPIKVRALRNASKTVKNVSKIEMMNHVSVQIICRVLIMTRNVGVGKRLRRGSCRTGQYLLTLLYTRRSLLFSLTLVPAQGGLDWLYFTCYKFVNMR